MDIVDTRYRWNDKKYGKEIDAFAAALEQVATSYGLESGAKWKSFGKRGDWAHVQLNRNNPMFAKTSY